MTKKILCALLLLSAPAWSSFQPVTGSSVTVFTTAGGSLSVSQTSAPNLKASVLLDGTSNTVQITGTPNVYVTNVTTSPVQVQNGAGALVGVGWQAGGSSVPVHEIGTANVSVAAALPVGANNIGTVTGSTVTANPGIAQNAYGSNGTAWTQGTSVGQSILTKSGLTGVWTGPDITFPSFSASTGTLASAASATDIAQLCGNANNTVIVTDWRASCTETTAGNVLVQMFKRSVADTGVIATTGTAVAQDTNYAVAASSVAFYTANPTVGTSVGLADSYQLGCMASATATPNDIYVMPSNYRIKPIVLRGTAQCLDMNLNGVTVTGSKFTVTYSWFEVTTP